MSGHRGISARIRRWGLASGLGLTLAGCAAHPPSSGTDLACGALFGQPMLEAQLIFGRNIGPTLGVTDADWAAFLAREVLPRFPDGLTLQEANGYWRDRETGQRIREPTLWLTLLIPHTADHLERLRAIATAYRQTFHQQSVGVVLRPACVDF